MKKAIQILLHSFDLLQFSITLTNSSGRCNNKHYENRQTHFYLFLARTLTKLFFKVDNYCVFGFQVKNNMIGARRKVKHLPPRPSEGCKTCTLFSQVQ